MKKVITLILPILFIAAILLTQFVSAQNEEGKRWIKVNNYIYIDKNSIEEKGDGKSAWLKFYNSSENELSPKEIGGIPVHYEVTNYEAYCDSDPALFLNQTQLYDKNSNLLSEEINNTGIGAGCSGWVDGEIICKAICEN